MLAREISKAFETIRSGSAQELAAWVVADTNQQLGEIVLLARGAESKAKGDASIDPESEQLMGILLQELSLKQAVSLGVKITGLPRKLLYSWALQQRS